ncbi:AI-2E family transporter [Novosphingobium marinum]|uniref:Putative PurR-regulated permease PerM n=1 Tax=Novosphingobium marinum TaxID=1514948 RepID=A0A7Y9XSP5_9SPHN|nr:AI-2E family transporter [Novosphingobium marinum]NYH93797.1 putative PurR-regulated permease PerM [Novosphingobium marinum]GGC17332.1 AI-2E family transporter [Novosphingobium marinum]
MDRQREPHEPSAWPRRERRLVSTLVLLTGVAVILALPFVLSAGSEFFLPVTISLILSIILSPVANFLRRVGLPNAIACLVSVLLVPVAFSLVALLILQPSVALLAQLPQLTRQIVEHIENVRGGFSAFTNIANELASLTGSAGQTEVVVAAPSAVEQIATATPAVVFETVLIVLFTFFMLEARFRMRRKLLLEREDFGASVRAARILRDVQGQVGTYILTASIIAACVGVIVALGAWALGLEAPVMWGGLAALLNLLPYFGPLVMTFLLAAFGLGTEASVLAGLAPAAMYLAMHTVEANFVTPVILGKRLTLSPIAILVSMSFFSWVWGVAGIFLSVPILLVGVALFQHVGSPNFVGFVFGEALFPMQEDPAAGSSATGSETPVNGDAVNYEG